MQRCSGRAKNLKKNGDNCTLFIRLRLERHRNNAIAIFRIYQESLTNIARHAEASRVDAVLKHEDNALTLTIHDNGKGFDLGSISQKGHLACWA